MRFCWWIGHSGTSAVIAAQFGLAMMPLWSRMRLRVDLGDHQRHVRIHPEGRGIVDHDGAGLHRDRRELARDAAAGREQRDVDAVEGVLGRAPRSRSCSPRKSMVLPAERALASAFSLPTRKFAPVHGGDEFGADGAGDADNGNDGIVVHVRSPLVEYAGNKKAPDLFRRGFGSDDAIVRLRAHGSRAPGGCFGFRGAFGGRDSWRGLMREDCAAVNGFWTQNQPSNGVEQGASVTP